MQESPETLVRIPDAPLPREVAARAGELLAAGRLVVLPTETVYGIAARADDAGAVAALRELKGQAPSRPFTWHVGTVGALEAFPRLKPLARRLARRYWPGPLTLVLDGVPPGLEGVAVGGACGVRLPAHRGTADLLAGLEFPVVMTSANRTGEEPATRADEALAHLGDAIDLALDGGPSRLGESSGVLRLGRGRFELLREGLLPLSDLRATAGLRIAFVCTGNTCRSPMAEGLARKLLGERLGGSPETFGFELSSMGVFAPFGAPASAHAVEVLRGEGIDLSGHTSRTARPEDVRRQDVVYALTAAHLEALRRELPPDSIAAGRGAGDGHGPRGVRLELLDPEGGDVPDPIGGPVEHYRACATRIREALERRLEEWA